MQSLKIGRDAAYTISAKGYNILIHAFQCWNRATYLANPVMKPVGKKGNFTIFQNAIIMETDHADFFDGFYSLSPDPTDASFNPDNLDPERKTPILPDEEGPIPEDSDHQDEADE